MSEYKDTYDLVKEYKAGYNIQENNLAELCKKIAFMCDDDYNQMSRNAKILFDENFSTNVFVEKLDKVLSNYLK